MMQRLWESTGLDSGMNEGPEGGGLCKEWRHGSSEHLLHEEGRA